MITYRPDETSLFSAGKDYKIETKCLLSNENSSKPSLQLKKNIQKKSYQYFTQYLIIYRPESVIHRPE